MQPPNLTVRAYHADGHWYRWWEAQAIYRSNIGLVTLTSVPHSVYRVDGTTWQSPYQIRAYYWYDRYYNLLEVHRADGSLLELYIHIASPARFVNGELHFTDHELDVIKLAHGPAEIVDEDEFEAAIETYGYSDELIATCREACQRAAFLAERWRVGMEPRIALGMRDNETTGVKR